MKHQGFFTLVNLTALMTAYLVPLHHFLIQEVWESSEWVELSGALGTSKDVVFIDNTATADGDQWHTVTAQTFIEIYVSSLPLCGHRDGSAQRQQTKHTTGHRRTTSHQI